MSGTLQRGGPIVLRDEWERLRHLVTELADVYAAAHPMFAYLYRQEAHDFSSLAAPADAQEFATRQAEAEALRRKWADRVRHYG